MGTEKHVIVSKSPETGVGTARSMFAASLGLLYRDQHLMRSLALTCSFYLTLWTSTRCHLACHVPLGWLLPGLGCEDLDLDLDLGDAVPDTYITLDRPDTLDSLTIARCRRARPPHGPGTEAASTAYPTRSC